VRLVQLPPAGADGVLVPELTGRRGAAELDERRIRPVAQVEQVSVDPATLPPPRRAADHALTVRA
jgi:hypothetical protein